MGSSFWFDTIDSGWSIVKGYNFQMKLYIFLSPNIAFVLANGEDPIISVD